MDRQGAGCRGPVGAGSEGIGDMGAGDDQLGTVVADPLRLRRRGDARHEDRRLLAEPHCGIGDGGAVIAARGGGDPDARDFAHQQVGEGAARLERAGMLQVLELEGEATGRQAEIGGVDVDDGGPPDIGPDELFCRGDASGRR